MGLIIIFGVHKIQFKYFRGISILLLPIAIILLIITALKGTTIDGSYASRWLTIPVVNMSFQTSSFASIVLMVYVARYLSRIAGKPIRFKDTILPLWIPVFIVVGLIFPSNFSTAAIIFSMVLLIAFLSGYPIKYSAVIVGFSLSAFILFIAISKAFPGLLPNRVDTWTSRIENFLPNDNSEKEEDEPYQVRESKIAIATGGINGKGIGKSVQRNFLPQSSSDFIYAIIIEETGLIGGFFVLFIYLYLLLRIAIIFTKNESLYGKLLVAAVGLPIIFQAFINIGVAVNLFPVTGQTLPLISSGGSSIWMTCVGLGIILSVSAKNNKDYTEKELKYTKEEQENPLDVLSQTL
jgi:cell division protein FtsW